MGLVVSAVTSGVKGVFVFVLLPLPEYSQKLWIYSPSGFTPTFPARPWILPFNLQRDENHFSHTADSLEGCIV